MELIYACCLFMWGIINPSAIHELKNDHTVVSFTTRAPIGTIHGQNEEARSSINLSTGAIYVVAKNTAFEFSQKFIKKRFNDEIMESERYPFSEFIGKLHSNEDLLQQGHHRVYVDGLLKIHGVQKEYHTYAWITVSGDRLTTLAHFKIKSADHHIKVPTILLVKFAEELDVAISGTYTTPHG